jgi:hypothetical protein
VVDTAGDGAVSFFTSAGGRRPGHVPLQHDLTEENTHRARDHQLVLRTGLHWGRVLTDGVQVTGDVMNLCARIAASADPGQIRLSRDCLPRAGHRPAPALPAAGRRGTQGPAGRWSCCRWTGWTASASRWRCACARPASASMLPLQDIVSFGRMDIIEGMSANDVVLTLPDGLATRQISRWHFELRRRPAGYLLRSVTSHPTLVDGQLLQRGDEVAIAPGSVVSLSGVMTLDFIGTSRLDGTRSDETMVIT